MPAAPDRGAAATPLGLLLRAAHGAPADLALACGEVRLTYADYAHAVAALAKQLVEGGAAGRVVALLLRNGIELPIALFAAQAAGAGACALNPDYTPRELAPMLTLAKPAVTITHADLAEKVQASLDPAVGGALVVLPDNTAAWVRALLAQEPAPLAEPSPDAIGLLQFTGGTTGRSKGVLLTHRALAANVAQREAVLPTAWRDERIVCMMPLYHSFASAMGLLMAANCAGSLHILPRYRPDWTLDTIERAQVTRLPAGPTVFNSLLGFEGLRRERLASLRCTYSGSAPLSLETLRRWEAATGVQIYEGYGQSEAGPILTYHGPGMALKQGSVGPALPGTQLRIIAIDDPARVLPAGEVGEIVARGPQIMAGYLDEPEATAEALRDGWLHTGDIGRLDEDGYLFITDRKKDLVIVGGYNVYPREIDEVVMACPGVVEAAAVGVPDTYRGEVVWAFFAGRVDEAQLAAHCEAALVRYKRPVRFVRLDALPKTPVGKIDKQACKRLALGMSRAARAAE